MSTMSHFEQPCRNRQTNTIPTYVLYSQAMTIPQRRQLRRHPLQQTQLVAIKGHGNSTQSTLPYTQKCCVMKRTTNQSLIISQQATGYLPTDPAILILLYLFILFIYSLHHSSPLVITRLISTTTTAFDRPYHESRSPQRHLVPIDHQRPASPQIVLYLDVPPLVWVKNHSNLCLNTPAHPSLVMLLNRIFNCDDNSNFTACSE